MTFKYSRINIWLLAIDGYESGHWTAKVPPERGFQASIGHKSTWNVMGPAWMVFKSRIHTECHICTTFSLACWRAHHYNVHSHSDCHSGGCGEVSFVIRPHFNLQTISMIHWWFGRWIYSITLLLCGCILFISSPVTVAIDWLHPIMSMALHKPNVCTYLLNNNRQLVASAFYADNKNRWGIN